MTVSSGTALAGRHGQGSSSCWAWGTDGMKLRAMGGGLISTSSPDGIDMGITCASPTTISDPSL